MKNPFLLVFICFCGIWASAQTGPGGVGSTTNNKLWLDANRGVTVSGTSVTAWADQSGNAFNAAPSAVVARPAFVSNSANGYPTIDFDGTNDEFWINDNAAFDLTQWHIFIVPLIDNQKNYNAFLVKGNDSNENYEMLGFSDASMHMPILYTDATRTFPNTTTAQLTATANIFEYSYSSAVGRDVYRNNNSIHTDNESKTPSTNNFSLYIGNERNTTGRFLDGDLAEVIMYNAPLNSAQRIIVNNYLAAKYNCTLTTNDIYVQDNAANGNFDHNVAGIGRVDAGNIQNDSQGSGVVRILNPVGLGNNEYYIWGHDNGAFGSYTTSDFPAGQGVQGRLVRVWRGTEQGSITSFDVRFDLTGLGSVTASHLRLLIDTDNDGTFADETTAGGGVVSGAALVSGNIYGFTGVTGLNNNLRFTLGTTSLAATPLPVELTEFRVAPLGDKAKIMWSTASEINHDWFVVERSEDGINFEEVLKVKGAGNSNIVKSYNETDYEPVLGTSYYRLKHVSTSGESGYSSIVSLDFKKASPDFEIAVIPNPSDGIINVEISGTTVSNANLLIHDVSGNLVVSKTIATGHLVNIVKDNGEKLSPGTYVLNIKVGNETKTQKIIVK
ncbi:MAG: T9SS type A sorting domain-containing protein [Bacteroidia bacterium]|nr:T9SS type A sorting domain-containing protein [Bacteroidia bacterium]